MKILLIVFLFSLYIPVSHAEIGASLQQLQQRANAAYEQMMQARREADNLQKDAAFAERELQAARNRLADREKALKLHGRNQLKRTGDWNAQQISGRKLPISSNVNGSNPGDISKPVPAIFAETC